MKPCKRVGLDICWRCTWRCVHCFYANGYSNDKGKLGDSYDVPLHELLAKVDKARARGIDHMVAVGWGEPALAKNLKALLLACKDRGMTTSIITNGVQPISHYAKMYFEWGLDHLHISSHGFGETLNKIAMRDDAGEKQLKLKEWLYKEELPFRTNFTMQQINYKEMPETLVRDTELGAFHVVMLGFLPHYNWSDPQNTARVGVHPNLLRPYIEETSRRLTELNQLFTIRYHPFCHLDSKYWKHIVNTKYVNFDPYEWNYELQADNIPALWNASCKMGAGTRTQDPCNRCELSRHCGGWNVKNVNGINMQGEEECKLTAINTSPEEYRKVWKLDGGIHDMNPVNHLDGVTPSFVKDSRRQGKTNPFASTTSPIIEEIEETFHSHEHTPSLQEEDKPNPFSLKLIESNWRD